MTITAALVLFAALWFLILFLVIQCSVRPQSESGQIVRGTPASAPRDEIMKTVMWRTTWISIPVWAILVAIILSGWINLADFDVFNVIET